MTKNFNINKISFSDFNENLLFGANITGSIGNFDIPKKISNNEALSIENLESMKFQKELNEYEKKINEKKEEKFHFNFKGEVTENQSHHTNDSNDLEIYFLSDEDIKNKCRFYSNNNYVVFENNNGENACYLNVFLHFLYSCKDISYFLCNLYIIDRQDNHNKTSNGYDDNNANNTNEQNNNEVINKEEDKNKLLILLGQILYNYNEALKNKKKRVTVLKTKKFRQFLNNFSKGKFRLNHVADTVDFVNYIFEILNEQNKEETEKYFVLKLNEHYVCNQTCNIKKTTKYDNDNFIYQIYTEEILNFLQSNKNIKFYNRLFQFSQMLFLQDSIKCSKCGKEMYKKICCDNKPKILIINCVWNEEMPNINKVIKLYALIKLKDELRNLFQITNKKKKNFYSLTHIILYSSSLSHYIIAIYDPISKIFYLVDDNMVIEFKKLVDLYSSVTANLLRSNEYYYYYPVLLIYSNSEKYDQETLDKNQMNEEIYINLINECKKSIQEYKDRKNKNKNKSINNNISNNSNNNNNNNNNINNNNNNKTEIKKSKDNIEKLKTSEGQDSFPKNKNNNELTVENSQSKVNEVINRNIDNNDINNNEENISQSIIEKNNINANINNNKNNNSNKNDNFSKKKKDNKNNKEKSSLDNVKINNNNFNNINNSTKIKNTNNQNNEFFGDREENSKPKIVKSYNLTNNLKNFKK
jgi:hypothetical protein